MLRKHVHADASPIPADPAEVMTSIETLDAMLMKPVSEPFTMIVEFTTHHKYDGQG